MHTKGAIVFFSVFLKICCFSSLPAWMRPAAALALRTPPPPPPPSRRRRRGWSRLLPLFHRSRTRWKSAQTWLLFLASLEKIFFGSTTLGTLCICKGRCVECEWGNKLFSKSSPPFSIEMPGKDWQEEVGKYLSLLESILSHPSAHIRPFSLFKRGKQVQVEYIMICLSFSCTKWRLLIPFGWKKHFF